MATFLQFSLELEVSSVKKDVNPDWKLEMSVISFCMFGIFTFT